MKYLLITTLILTLFSCAKFENDYDFRNYIRDKHPYCELKSIDLDDYKITYSYLVYDTINNKTYLYNYDGGVHIVYIK